MLQKNLLKWYGFHQRDLPWRSTRDPYIIWLSEIILQQTRVQQGLPYFLVFSQKFPRVDLMARATEEEILKLWQGLGYYSRARNMHQTAKMVVKEFGGVFPTNYSSLLGLKGIGSYTAAAISSFANDEPVAVLDGNVYRVLARFFAEAEPINTSGGKRVFSQLANQFLNVKKPAAHNQAMMELGSLVCKPIKPDCENCPLQTQCLAHQTGKQMSFPVKKEKAKVKARFFNYILFRVKGEIALFKRPAGDIWQGLYDLPLVERKKPLSFEELTRILENEKWMNSPNKIRLIHEGKHVLTHQHIYAHFYLMPSDKKPALGEEFIWIPEENWRDYAIPRLLDKFLIWLNTSGI